MTEVPNPLHLIEGRNGINMIDTDKRTVDIVRQRAQALLKSYRPGRLVYLASPLSSADETVLESRIKTAGEVTRRMIEEEIYFFSPLNHCEDDIDLPSGTESFWYRLDFRVLEGCDEVVVITQDGWKGSVGVRAEIEFALERDKPVYGLDPVRYLSAETPAFQECLSDLEGIATYETALPDETDAMSAVKWTRQDYNLFRGVYWKGEGASGATYGYSESERYLAVSHPECPRVYKFLYSKDIVNRVGGLYAPNIESAKAMAQGLDPIIAATEWS